jgi:hypothetical protein
MRDRTNANRQTLNFTLFQDSVMNKILSLLIVLTLLSCDREKGQWTILKENPRFTSIFKFGYDNRESTYLDSVIIILNDSLSNDKNFWLKFHDDTVDFIDLDYSDAYKIPKRNVIFYNTNLNELKYIDSTYTAQNKIDSVIKEFIRNIEWGGFYIYSDTLKCKSDWLSLFATIDKIAYAYQTAREDYAIVKYGLKYRNIHLSQKAEVRKKIRMPIAIYFKHPFPPPPPLSDSFPRPTYIIPDFLDTIKNR